MGYMALMVDTANIICRSSGENLRFGVRLTASS